MLDIDPKYQERAMMDWLEDEAARHQAVYLPGVFEAQCAMCHDTYPCKFADSLLP